jgi:uncharacterized protein
MGHLDKQVDEFRSDLLATRAMRRLGKITFLGAIDFVQPSNGNAPNRRRHYRLEHSVGVAKLIAKYCEFHSSSQSERLHLQAAALLHDVGHGPLSHTLEPIFKTAFEVDHHSVGMAHILGKTKIGVEVSAVLLKWKIDRERLAELVNTQSNSCSAKIFSSSHNADTIEGITRTMAMVRPVSKYRSAEEFFERVWLKEFFNTDAGDEFWTLKNEAYKLHINGAVGRLMDAIAKSYMKSRLSEFSPSDFLQGEDVFKKKHALLFQLLSSGRSFRALSQIVDSKMMDTEVEFVTREFRIDDNADSPSARYLQFKSKKSAPLSTVVRNVESNEARQLDMGLS